MGKFFGFPLTGHSVIRLGRTPTPTYASVTLFLVPCSNKASIGVFQGYSELRKIQKSHRFLVVS
jgi:hypothetical protein